MSPVRKLYDKKLVMRYVLTLVLVVVAMKLTGGIGFAVVIPFAFLALTRNRPESLFFCMFLFVAMVVGNPNLIPKGAIFFMEQRATVMLFGFIMALRVSGVRKSPYLVPFLSVMPYVVYMIIPSFDGWCPTISYLKLFLFVVVFLAYWGIANVVATHPRDNLSAIRSVVLSVAVFFLMGSILLLPFPGISQMSPEAYLDNPNLNSLFMGMTGHSQCLGPIVSGLFTILYADLLFGVRKPNKLYLALLLCCPILIWKTSSRTAMGTFLCGLMLATYFFMRARFVGSRWKNRVMGWCWCGAILAIIVMSCSSSVQKRALQFIQKRGEKGATFELSIENIYATRMGLWEKGLTNFKKKPLIGNGFQVSVEMQELKDLPFVKLLSAPIEKGVWITAILEEGGVIGFAMFVCFLLVVFFHLVKRKAYIAASTFFVFILSNMGEFSFFSMSYLGGFMWTLVFAAVMLDSSRVKAEMYERQRQMMMRAQMLGGPSL